LPPANLHSTDLSPDEHSVLRDALEALRINHAAVAAGVVHTVPTTRPEPAHSS
jgi:hypothetical protein